MKDINALIEEGRALLRPVVGMHAEIHRDDGRPRNMERLQLFILANLGDILSRLHHLDTQARHAREHAGKLSSTIATLTAERDSALALAAERYADLEECHRKLDEPYQPAALAAERNRLRSERDHYRETCVELRKDVSALTAERVTIKRIATLEALALAAKEWRACYDDDGEICRRQDLGDREQKLSEAIDALGEKP